MILRHRIIFGTIAVGVVATGLIARWLPSSSFSPVAQEVGNWGLMSLLVIGIGAMVLMGICFVVPPVKRVLIPMILIEAAWRRRYRMPPRI